MRRTNLVVAVTVVAVVAACGSSDDGSGGATSEPVPDRSTVDEADHATTTEPSSNEEPETTSASEPALPSGAGTATLTIGDETIEFSGLGCVFDNEAIELVGEDDASFGAMAQSDGARMAMSVAEKAGLKLFEVFYEPEQGSGELWYMNATEIDRSYTLEDGQVTATGEFDLVVDSEEIRSETGTVEASCS